LPEKFTTLHNENSIIVICQARVYSLQGFDVKPKQDAFEDAFVTVKGLTEKNWHEFHGAAQPQPKTWRALAEVAWRYGILVISDEIYGELHHVGRHVSMARYYPEGTIVSGGLSKWCGAGGWRLAL